MKKTVLTIAFAVVAVAAAFAQNQKTTLNLHQEAGNITINAAKNTKAEVSAEARGTERTKLMAVAYGLSSDETAKILEMNIALFDKMDQLVAQGAKEDEKEMLRANIIENIVGMVSPAMGDKIMADFKNSK